jgi:hypothetical protein
MMSINILAPCTNPQFAKRNLLNAVSKRNSLGGLSIADGLPSRRNGLNQLQFASGLGHRAAPMVHTLLNLNTRLRESRAGIKHVWLTTLRTDQHTPGGGTDRVQRERFAQ